MSVTSLPGAAVLVQAAQAAMREIPDPPAGATEAVKQRVAARRRTAASRALDQWAPAIDQLTDQIGAAAFTGLTYDSVRRKRNRIRADGTREWPEPDPRFRPDDAGESRFPGGTGARKTALWTYRTIVLHMAEAPGRGHPGMPGRRSQRRQEPSSSQPEEGGA